jgi:general secretion pathway protein D
MDRRDRRRLFAAALLLAPLASAAPARAQSEEEIKAKQAAAEAAGIPQDGQDDAKVKERAAAAAARGLPQDTVGARPGLTPAPAQPAQPAQIPVAPAGGRPGVAPPNNVQNNPAGARPAQPAQRPNTPAPSNRPSSGAAGTEGSGEIVDVGDFYVLSIDENTEGIDLMWLTKMCQVATGKNLTPDKSVATQLVDTKIKMFGQKRIPKAEFYEFYQILMFINGFTITKVGPDHLAVYLIQGMNPQAGARAAGGLKDEAIYVMPDELDRYADQVATQILTVLHLPNYDVRTLQSTLRPLMPNDQTGSGIMPVGNTQSVVLRGFAPNIVALARILRLVDQEAAKDTGVAPAFEVIPLEFAAAEDLAEILEQLLEARKRESQARRQANPQGATGQIQNGGGESKILTYPRTNSLLVMALPSDMQAIKELVARLDVEVVEPERTYHVYALEHVKAADLSEVLEDFLQSAQRVQQQGAGGRGGAAQAAPAATGLTSRDNEVVVVPDEATNSLLIAASRRRYEEVLELIHRLDLRQDQVLIETALIELSGRNNLDLGVELGVADVPGSGTGGFGVSSFGLSTFTDTNNDGIPDIRTPTLGNGITAGIIDADDFSLPILVRALRDRQDTNVLNIPSVLVNNNGSATVNTLDEQPTTQITNAGVGGQTQENFNDYQKAGITMQISPSISLSGYLRLSVSLEVSNFVGTFSGPIPPPRITRSLQTSVNVPNGDTMVIGGIVVDNKSEQRTSIPWLGDIPVLGTMFRRDVDNQNRTTLYFFVTPHILKDKNFADLAEISYKVKLDAAEKIGAERVRLIDTAFGAKEGEVDFRGFDVPLYRPPGGGEIDASMVGQDPKKATGKTDPQGADKADAQAAGKP